MIPPTTLWRSFNVWRSWRAGRRVPLSITYFVNGQCNLRCRGCFFFEHPPDGDPRTDAPASAAELDTAQAKDLIDDVARMGVPFLELVGGEPFLRRDLIELARYARQRGLWCGVTTNGTRFTDDLARAARAAFRTIFVSIDGFEPAHDAVRGAGNHAKTIDGLRRLLAAPGPALVGVSTIVGPENVASLPSFAEHVRSLGVAQLVLSSGLAPAPAVDPATASPVLARLKQMRRELPGFLPQDEHFFDALLGFYRGEGRYGCHVDQLLHVSVSPAGEASACCMWPVPLGPARDRRLAGTLAATTAATLAPVAQCSGCARHDYAYTMNLFQRPLPKLVSEGLALALGRDLSAPARRAALARAS